MEGTHSPAAEAPPVDDEADYDYTPEADPADAAPEVSSYIAIIRIISVLVIGVCVSFGMFMALLGIKGLMLGIPLILLAIPVFYGMMFAEQLAARRQPGDADGG